MIPSRHYASIAIVGALAMSWGTGTGASGDEMSNRGAIVRIDDRCAHVGPGLADTSRLADNSRLVETGNGVCGRIGGHARIEVHGRTAASNVWSTGGTTRPANLQSADGGIVPGPGTSHHLRVRSGLENYNPFH